MEPILPTPTPSPIYVYAGFWRRFNAYGIDATIVLLLAWMIDFAILSNPAFAQSADDFKQITDAVAALQSGQIPTDMMAMAQKSLIDSMLGGSIIGVDNLLMIAVSAIYNILFVVGHWQATPGKHWLRMKVMNADGSKPTLAKSSLRHVVSGISMLPLGLGCLTIFFTKERLAPHDMIAGTRVIMRERT